MKIEHIAIWVKDLESMKDFYVNTFDMTHNDLYHNTTKNFKSYFLSPKTEGIRIELMTRPDIEESDKYSEIFGIAHLAFSVGSKEKVDEMTENMRNSGHQILGGPRTTGDGYYESVVADPEGNKIELTI